MRRLRWIIVLTGLALAIGAGLWLVDRTIEGILLTQVDAYLRARTLALVHAREGTALTIELPVLNLNLVRRRLVLERVRIHYLETVGGRTQEFAGDAPRVTITGVDLTDAIWHRNFRLGGVSIDAPVLRHLVAGPADSAPGERQPGDTIPLTLPAADSLLYGVVAAWLPDAVRGGRIGRVEVKNATLASMQVKGKAVTFDSSAGLSLSMRGLQLDSTRHRIFERARLTVGTLLHTAQDGEDSLLVRDAEVSITPDDTAFSLASLRTGPPAGGHALAIHGIRRSHARRMLTIDSVRYAPPVPDTTFFRVAPPRSARIDFAARDIRVVGLRQENLRKRRLTAGGVWIAGLTLNVLADRRVPGVPKRRALWTTRFAELNWVVGADSAIVDSATVRYAEWPPGVPRPASVVFDRIRLRLLHATNDTAVSDSLPLVIHGQGRLLGEAPFETTIQVHVGPGPLRLAMSGQVGAMALERFNSWAIPGSGVEITQGALDHVRFDFTTAAGRSTGRYRAQWRDLDLRLVDPATGKQNFGRKLKSIMARSIARDDNLPDEEGKLQGEKIDYRVQPTDTFWGLIWRSLRSGMMRAVKG